MFKKLFGSRHSQADNQPPPEWTSAAETSYRDGLRHEASDNDYETAEKFCLDRPINPPKFLESHLVDRISIEGAAAWQIASQSLSRFKGSIIVDQQQKITHVASHSDCLDTCLLSIDVSPPGTVCQPHPLWRLPGWNRQSAGLHLDDMRKFFEDPNGGRDYTGTEGYLDNLQPDDTFGFAYEFNTGNIFFTRNGVKLPIAFYGKYLPTSTSDGVRNDVYAAVGICGQADFTINYGTKPFKWGTANNSEWRVEKHVGRLSVSNPGLVYDELPAYS
ncbi:hypothetical protein Clacol_010156 [Clathrus columnatus]|uniref:Uncharacterized protein n=1 Tax=Clathrus columnatus TaxID=1419009 RepID=A0AAV5AS98_9AGAM|nr:hypothetical protein Clacol_010156 [Clathrus columnatus]